MMRLMSQTVRSLENANFNADDPKRQWCIMALSNTYNDVRVSIFPKRLVRAPKRS